MKINLLHLAAVTFYCSSSFAVAAEKKTYTPEKIATESARLNAFFDKCFDENVARHPQFASQLGLKSDYDKWDDISDAATTNDLAIALQISRP